jgi:hypothetical protein
MRGIHVINVAVEKAIRKLVTYPESVFEALYIQHATRMLDTWLALK